MFLFIFALVNSVLRTSFTSSSFEDRSVFKNGDVLIGVLFPLYRKDLTGDCTVLNKDNFLWVRALEFTLDELKNSKDPFLKNVTFGLNLRDTCYKSALEHSLDILHNNKDSKSMKISSKKAIAVLTSYNDADSTTLLNLFKIPQIVFSERMYDKSGTFPYHHPYYFESIKTNYYKAKSLVALIKYFKWESIFVLFNKIYSKDYLIFKHFAEMENICIALELENTNFNKQGISAHNDLLELFGQGSEVRVVLLFTGDMDMLKAIRSGQATKPSYFTWIDAMGTAPNIAQEISRTRETVFTLVPEFLFLGEIKNHISSECNKISARNKDSYYREGDPCDTETSINVILENTLDLKNWNSRTTTAHKRARDLQGIVNGVLAIAHAVSRFMETKCLDQSKEECFEEFQSQDLANELQVFVQKLFHGESNPENLRKKILKENMFSLVSIHDNSSNPVSSCVGTWDKNWYINREGIVWPGRTSKTPYSTCGPTCPLGHIKVVESARKCCWSCQPCNYNQYITNNFTCADCVRGYWPSKDFRSCEFKLQLTLLSCAVAFSSVTAVLYTLVI